jgi:hypothetical protein
VSAFEGLAFYSITIVTQTCYDFNKTLVETWTTQIWGTMFFGFSFSREKGYSMGKITHSPYNYIAKKA